MINSNKHTLYTTLGNYILLISFVWFSVHFHNNIFPLSIMLLSLWLRKHAHATQTKTLDFVFLFYIVYSIRSQTNEWMTNNITLNSHTHTRYPSSAVVLIYSCETYVCGRTFVVFLAFAGTTPKASAQTLVNGSEGASNQKLRRYASHLGRSNDRGTYYNGGWE